MVEQVLEMSYAGRQAIAAEKQAEQLERIANAAWSWSGRVEEALQRMNVTLGSIEAKLDEANHIRKVGG